MRLGNNTLNVRTKCANENYSYMYICLSVSQSVSFVKKKNKSAKAFLVPPLLNLHLILY